MRTHRLLALPALLVVSLLACSSEVTQLDGAVGTIPIFNPSTFKERSSSFTSDDLGDPMKFSTYTWYLETEASPADVEAFYAAQWPGAGRTEVEGSVTLRNPPLPEYEDDPLGESLSVTIELTRVDGKTQFNVSEDVFANRRRQ